MWNAPQGSVFINGWVVGKGFRFRQECVRWGREVNGGEEGSDRHERQNKNRLQEASREC